MRTPPTTVRLSASLRDLLAQAGGDTSAATRALLLLGAQAAGLDLSGVQDDLRRLAAADLDPRVAAALAAGSGVRQVYDRRRTPVVHPPVERDLPPRDADDDPLGGIGIEV